MNGTKTAINRKLLSMAVVLIMCAAALVTVAYAYNANYKDTVNGTDVDPQENSKYIYVTGTGLSYPGTDIDATIEVEYITTTNTVTTSGTEKTQEITTKPTGYKITDLSDGTTTSVVTFDKDTGMATVKIGTVSIVNKNTDAKTVTLVANSLTQTELASGSYSLFKEDLTSSNVFFKVSAETAATDYSNVFTFSDNKVVVEVYIVAAVDTEPSADRFNYDETRYIDPTTGKLYLKDKDGNPVESTTGTLTTTMKIPGFSLVLSASDDSGPITKTGTASAADIAAVKNAAASDSNVTFKIATTEGASITLNNSAIKNLGSDSVALSVSEASAPTGVSAAYEITLGSNTFSNDGDALTITIPYELKAGDDKDNISIAYIKDEAVDTVYPATYSEVDGKGYVTFTTSHLSTYGVMSGYDAVGEVTCNGVTTIYDDFDDAIIAGRVGTSTLTLLDDVTTESCFGLKANANFTVDLNGFSITDTSSLFYVGDGVETTLSIIGTKAGSTISAPYIVFNDFSTPADHVFDLNVNGGKYISSYGFILYDAGDVAISNATFDVTAAAIWDGNVGPQKITISNCTIESDATGIYFGSQAVASIENVNVTSVGSALEIKSGTVSVSNSAFVSSTYSVSDSAINHDGTGSAEAVIVINNAYCVNTSTDGVSVTMTDTSASYTTESGITDKAACVIVTDTDDNAPGKNISLTWTGNDSNIEHYVSSSVTVTINGTDYVKESA